MLQRVMEVLFGARDDGGPRPMFARSGKWPKVREMHLLNYPTCTVCGTKKYLTVHHVVPVHIEPERELDFSNLMTLCEPQGGGCHLLFGHLRLWMSHNPNVASDATVWREKIGRRP
jgi:hypothetical protein